jgi:hypothetical protein
MEKERSEIGKRCSARVSNEDLKERQRERKNT